MTGTIRRLLGRARGATSPARQALAAANAALAEAEHGAERASAPVIRLRAIIAARDETVAAAAAARAPYDARVGGWLASGEGLRPELPAVVQAVIARLAALTEDADAAAAALPEHEARAQAAAKRVGEATRARDAAVNAVAVEALKGLVTGELLPGLRKVLAAEAMLLGIRDELREAGLLYAGAVITDVLAASARTAGLGRDTLAWRRLADALSAAPAGALVAEALLLGLRDNARASNTSAARGFFGALVGDSTAKLRVA